MHLRSEIARLEKSRLKIESAVAKLQLENLDTARRKSNGKGKPFGGHPIPASFEALPAPSSWEGLLRKLGGSPEEAGRVS